MKRLIIILWICLVVLISLVLIFSFDQNQDYDEEEMAEDMNIFIYLDTPDSRLIKR